MLQHESNTLSKILVVGDSGSGKTGALASLIDAGYNIRVLDFDNGLSVLKGFVKDKSALAAVHYATLRDELRLIGDTMGIKKANAFQRAMLLLDQGGDLWGEASPPIPPLVKWTAKDILVIDSLGLMGRSCLLMVMQANGILARSPEIQNYGVAMENMEKFIAQITSPSISCNIIVNAHLYKPNDQLKLAPDVLGDKLGPKIPKYFDTMVSLSLTAGKRTFKTKSDGLFACKTSVRMQDTFPIETGLRDMFAKLQDGGGGEAPATE